MWPKWANLLVSVEFERRSIYTREALGEQGSQRNGAARNALRERFVWSSFYNMTLVFNLLRGSLCYFGFYGNKAIAFDFSAQRKLLALRCPNTKKCAWDIVYIKGASTGTSNNLVFAAFDAGSRCIQYHCVSVLVRSLNSQWILYYCYFRIRLFQDLHCWKDCMEEKRIPYRFSKLDLQPVRLSLPLTI